MNTERVVTEKKPSCGKIQPFGGKLILIPLGGHDLQIESNWDDRTGNFSHILQFCGTLDVVHEEGDTGA
jgi:hypothetical protein